MADHGHSHAPGDHSHSHSHDGEDHGHSHGPPPQTPMLPPIDPAGQAVIDAEFVPVNLALHPDNNTAVCAPHKLEKCDTCNVDFVNTNRLAKILAANPHLACPPPSQMVNPKLSQMVQSTKDEGNALFKRGEFAQALTRYTGAASLAVQRPPWETNQVMRDELSTVLSNRSAAYFDLGDYISALADAEAVIALRRSWPKGHYRRAKALLGLKRVKEAGEALRVGLAFEPTNGELLSILGDVERRAQKDDELKRSGKQPGDAVPTSEAPEVAAAA